MSSYGRNPADIVLNEIQNNEFKKGAGRVSENDIAYALLRGMRGKMGTLTPVMETEEDKKRGTDLFWQPEEKDRIRIDITLNFQNKDHMPVIRNGGLNVVSKQYPVQYGIRIGNSYKNFTEFKEPVVVIGLDMSGPVFRKWEDAVLDGTEKHASEILDTAYDVYDQFINPDPNKRREATERLKINPFWQPLKKISPNYAKLIRQTKEMDEQINKNPDNPNNNPNKP